jgi:hypothetical protein
MRTLGPINPTGGVLGLPGNFLIARDGRVAAVKYGEDAYDQWTIDQTSRPRPSGACVMRAPADERVRLTFLSGHPNRAHCRSC